MTEFKKGDMVKHRLTGGLYLIGDIRSYYVRGYKDNFMGVVDVEDIELASDANKARIRSTALAQAESGMLIAAKAKLKALNSGQN